MSTGALPNSKDLYETLKVYSLHFTSLDFLTGSRQRSTGVKFIRDAKMVPRRSVQKSISSPISAPTLKKSPWTYYNYSPDLWTLTDHHVSSIPWTPERCAMTLADYSQSQRTVQTLFDRSPDRNCLSSRIVIHTTIPPPIYRKRTWVGVPKAGSLIRISMVQPGFGRQADVVNLLLLCLQLGRLLAIYIVSSRLIRLNPVNCRSLIVYFLNQSEGSIRPCDGCIFVTGQGQPAFSYLTTIKAALLASPDRTRRSTA